MCSEPKHADLWLRAFRRDLPATPTALTSAFHFLVKRAPNIDLSATDDEAAPELEHIDALVVAALAEGAVIDGDLRAALEEVLGRTLWATGTDATKRETLLNQALIRAGHVRNRIGGDLWRAAFYRSGLPLRSALALREAVQDAAMPFCAALEDVTADFSSWLLWIASDVAPQTALLTQWADLDADKRTKALTLWVEGRSVADIELDFPEEWPVLERRLDLLPWVATAAVEFMLTAASRPDLRDHAHARTAIACLRYGVPSRTLCEFARRGVDRTLATSWKQQYDNLSCEDKPPLFEQYVDIRLAEQAAESQRLADEAEQERQLQKVRALPIVVDSPQQIELFPNTW